MVEQIFQMFTEGLFSVSDWFVYIMGSATGFGQLFIAVMFIRLLFRFILGPLFGSAGSDRASKKYTITAKSGGDE